MKLVIYTALFLVCLCVDSAVAKKPDSSDVSTGDASSLYHSLIWNSEGEQVLPQWIKSVNQTGGKFSENPNRWEIGSAKMLGRGSLVVELDRGLLETDLGISLIVEERGNADMAVQLLDADDQVISVDLVGNVMNVGKKEEATILFAVPLRKHPSATKISFQRLTGKITIYGIVPFPIMLGDYSETPLEARLDMLALCNQSLSPDSPTYKALLDLVAKKQEDLNSTGSSESTDSSPDEIHEPASAPNKNDGFNLLSDVVVGVDLRHSEMWAYGLDYLRKKGWKVVLIEGAITPEILKEIDILMEAGVHWGAGPAGFTDTEVELIEEYVRNGGHLFCAGQAWSWASYGKKTEEEFPLNMIGAKLGFTVKCINVGAPAYIDSFLVKGIDKIEQKGWWPSRIEFHSTKARPFIRDARLNILAGVLEHGSGRIAVFGHESIPAQNIDLVDNVLKYLLQGN